MQRYPALYYGIAILSGVALAYGIWPPLFFFLFGHSKINKLGFCLIALFGFIQASILMPTKIEKTISGKGHVTIHKIRKFENSYGYFGNLNCFISEDKTYYDLPVKFFRKDLLPSESNYIVSGTVKLNPNASLTLLPSSLLKKESFNNFSFLRFKLKEKFRNYLKEYIKDDLCYSFFSALATGEIDNRLLSLQFSKVGLSHTLAISGFHYSWLVFILGAFFQTFLSKRKSCILLLFSISLYFLFIGETPSLNRAWLAALIYFTGYLLKEPTSGLNSLGAALLISLILDPFVIHQIGFQLSYLATFGILAIYPSVELFLRKIFPKRNAFRIDFLLSSFCRNTIAITIGVNLATLPLILYHFHYFPFLSIFYNLFFPLAITFCMICLILSPLPLIGKFFLKIGEIYTTPLLNMVFYGTDLVEGGIWCTNFPFDTLVASLLGILLLGFWLEEKRYYLTRMSIQL